VRREVRVVSADYNSAPAPWTAVETEPYELEIQSVDGRTVAKVCLDDAPVRDYNESQYAAAKLMAAAPDMAGLLMEAQTGAFDANPIAHNNWLARVEAALKKAGQL
jgi:hypothetical protein